jgi:type IV pilus assembly protein PilO
MAISLGKLPWYGQIGAFVLLAMGGVGAFYYYYEMGAQAEMKARSKQLATLRSDIEKGLATAKKLPEFRAEVEELEARLTNLRAVLPEEKDVADLLRKLQTLAAQSQLTITAFKPASVVTKELHAEWPISIEVHGTYHNLASFFDQLGKFTRIVNITGLDVKTRAKQESNSTISATCVATTFVLLDTPTPAPAKPEKNGPRGSKPAKKVA